jgi:ATP-dependent protease ClpP protease subunit
MNILKTKGILVTGVITLAVIAGLSAGISKDVKPTEETTTEREVAPVEERKTETAVASKLTIKNLVIDKSKIVKLDMEVNQLSVDVAIEGLKEVLSINDEAYLVINSPGGSVFDGAKLISFIENSKKPIYTVCETLCASMGFQIFEVGTKRYMLDKSILMAHPASGGVSGQVENMVSLLTFVQKYVDRMDANVAKRAGISLEKFKIMVAHELWLEAVDAVNTKFADSLVSLSEHYDSDITVFSVREEVKRKLIKELKEFAEVAPGPKAPRRTKEFSTTVDSLNDFR